MKWRNGEIEMENRGNGKMEQSRWRNGKIVKWRNGEIEKLIYRGMQKWRLEKSGNQEMEKWRIGSRNRDGEMEMENSRNREMEKWKNEEIETPSNRVKELIQHQIKILFMIYSKRNKTCTYTSPFKPC